MRDHIMKRVLLCVLVCMLLLLWGCGQTPPVAETNPPTTETEPPATTEAPPPAPIETVREWLDETFSFRLSLMYMELIRYGFSQDSDMTCAADGSYSMTNLRKNWDHMAEHESEEAAEFYYRYEGNDLVCYMHIGDTDYSRMVLTAEDIQAQADSRLLLVGAPAIAPDYLQDLSVTQTEDAAVFTYRLPLKKLLADSTILSVFVNNALHMSGAKYDEKTDLTIGCTLETDPETYQPRSFVLDFTEIKPLVLSDGALSGEYALDTDLMYMTYTFDYDLPDSVTIPDEALS